MLTRGFIHSGSLAWFTRVSHWIQELHAGNNCIEEFPIEVIETLMVLRTLDLKNNRLKVLTPDITMIQGLERLDVSNNNLASLPYELGTLVHLKGLGVEGNPLRAIRRDIVKVSIGKSPFFHFIVLQCDCCRPPSCSVI